MLHPVKMACGAHLGMKWLSPLPTASLPSCAAALRLSRESNWHSSFDLRGIMLIHTALGSGPNSSAVINSICGNWGFSQLKVTVTQ